MRVDSPRLSPRGAVRADSPPDVRPLSRAGAPPYERPLSRVLAPRLAPSLQRAPLSDSRVLVPPRLVDQEELSRMPASRVAAWDPSSIRRLPIICWIVGRCANPLSALAPRPCP